MRRPIAWTEAHRREALRRTTWDSRVAYLYERAADAVARLRDDLAKIGGGA